MKIDIVHTINYLTNYIYVAVLNIFISKSVILHNTQYMKLIFSILLICQLQTICAQQKSEIKIDSGSGNDVEILQTAPNDSSQFTTLTLDKSDSNKLKVIQINDNSQNEKTNQRAWNWINNTNTIVSLIGGLILICTTLFLKSRKKER